MNNSNSGFELLIGRIIAFQALFSHSIWFAVSLEKKIRRKENYPESWKDFLLELQSLLSKQNQQLPEALSFLEEPFSLFSAWAPAGGFGLMATAGTSMWPICLHAHISVFVLLHCDTALGDNENIPFCLRIVSQFGNRSDLLFAKISLALSVLLRTSLPSRTVPPAAALQTSSNPRAPLAACLASLMCHAYQLIPYCSGPFPMQGLRCRWGSSLQCGWKHKRGCAFFHEQKPRVKPGSHLQTLWDLNRLLSHLYAPVEMNIMVASIHLMDRDMY